ncbi:MAG TPA: hypothetical protein H9867_04960 [Candidatus Corynebacterium gallistercoris]|uniref:Uncharacterized protein n=1 Tax=Candidatus Corynebacterium gallistercoris TaxID=2838530 RepID=A0A9D1UQE3_9CORY|nr:hypothetical protein [Candidatus Corynebacterium gallistercoris]
MRKFRDEAFEGNPPWLPTLVEVDEKNTQAWVGWKMGPRLAREIGVKNSARVLSVVGQEQPLFINSLFHSTRDRRSVLKFAVGAAIGAFALTGIKPQSVANAVKRSQVSKSEEFFLSEQISEDYFGLLESPDAQVAFAGYSIATDVQNRSANPGSRLQKIEDIDSYSTGIHPMGHVRTYQDGSKERSIGVIDLDNKKIFRAYELKKGRVIIQTGAAVYSLTEQRGVKVLSTSVNGSSPEVVEVRSLERAVANGEDPCGGCNGPGGPGDQSKISGTECDSEVDLGCALGLAGCAGCTAACLGTGGWACGFCLVTSCGGFIASNGCCKGDGSSHHVCKRCSAPL